MGGWFLDILIGYLVRVLIHLSKARGSQRWPIEVAIVHTTSAPYSYGGRVAEVIYSYRYQGHYLSGTHQKPFISHASAKQYLAGFPKDTRFSVRVNPANPKISVVREEDQDQTAMKLRARLD